MTACCRLYAALCHALSLGTKGFRACVGAVAACAVEGIGAAAIPARSAKITESGSFGAVPTTCGRQALQQATHTYRITGALSTDRHPMWPCAPAGRSPPLATQAGGGLSPPTNYYRWVATQTAAAPADIAEHTYAAAPVESTAQVLEHPKVTDDFVTGETQLGNKSHSLRSMRTSALPTPTKTWQSASSIGAGKTIPPPRAASACSMQLATAEMQQRHKDATSRRRRALHLVAAAEDVQHAVRIDTPDVARTIVRVTIGGCTLDCDAARSEADFSFPCKHNRPCWWP